VLAYLFIDGYSGDMVVVHQVKLYSLIIVGLLVVNAILILIPKVFNKLQVTGDVTEGKEAYIFIRCTFLVVDMGFMLYFGAMIILGIVDKYPWYLLIVVGLVFLGMSVLYIIDVVKDLIQIKKHKLLRKTDMLLAGFILFLLIGTFGISYITYSADWNAGVDHTPIFSKGDAGAEYRIPSMLVLPDDTIIAFAEQRTQAYLDWGDINIVSRISSDGGETWSLINIVVDNGTRTLGNPCPVYNTLTGTIHLLYNLDNKLVFETTSVDNGTSWSSPRHLTDEIGLDVTWNTDRFDYQHGTGPGIGIQMSSGRLVIPSYYFNDYNDKGCHVIYSDDNGTTWHKGEDLGVGEECQVVELLNGSLYLNARNGGGRGRFVATSNDGGETWNPWIEDSDLPDLGCMASIIRYTHSGPYNNALLFTNPYSSIRTNLTLQISLDEGTNWDTKIMLFEGSSAYSQLGSLSDGTVCFLAEAGPKDYRDSIQFCTYTLS
jgi:sialidase-1